MIVSNIKQRFQGLAAAARAALTVLLGLLLLTMSMGDTANLSRAWNLLCSGDSDGEDGEESSKETDPARVSNPTALLGPQQRRNLAAYSGVGQILGGISAGRRPAALAISKLPAAGDSGPNGLGIPLRC